MGNSQTRDRRAISPTGITRDSLVRILLAVSLLASLLIPALELNAQEVTGDWVAYVDTAGSGSDPNVLALSQGDITGGETLDLVNFDDGEPIPGVTVTLETAGDVSFSPASGFGG